MALEAWARAGRRAYTAAAPGEIEALDRAAAQAAERGWAAGGEAQAERVLEACGRLCAAERRLGAADVRRVCAAADRVGRAALGRELKAVPARAFTRYVELYAQLGRPDVTQLALARLAARWWRPPMAVCAAQLLALLRRAADDAGGGHGLRRTTDAGAGAVRARLRLGSARAVAEAELRRERWLRRAAKGLEYGAYGALAALLAKWLWLGASVVPAGATAAQRALALGAALGCAGLGVRLALRHSVMGLLTAPAADVGAWARASRIGGPAAPLPAASDDGARRILRRAFPAAPSEREMDEIADLLLAAGGARPRLSWRLRAALAWSRVARRLAVVEPGLLSDHGLRQRLATLWLHALLRMFPPHAARSARTAAAADAAVAELALFVRDRFGPVPLALPPPALADLAAFVALEAGPRALDAVAALAADGLLALAAAPAAAAAAAGPDPADFLASWHAADEALLAAPAADVARRRAAAHALLLTALLRRLPGPGPGPASQPDPRARRLERTLRAVVDAEPPVPLSAPLVHAAFAAAETLASAPAAARLARVVEARAAARDPAVARMLLHHRAPARPGWRLRAAAQDAPPVVACVAPYLRMLARADPASVDAFVARWRGLRILPDAAAAIRCLATAAAALPPARHHHHHSPASAHAARWAETACTWPSECDPPAAVAQPLCQLLAAALAACADDPRAARAVSSAWHALLARHPALRAHAAEDLCRADLRLLAAQAAATTATDAADAARCLRRALAVLDLMRGLGHAPDRADFAAVASAARRLSVDIGAHVRYWAPRLNQGARSTKIAAFARSLL
ncbi:hypothetical protein H4R18_001923 [Coemansia javaensis]|uniref:Uncharacterized protein n=1 Tax=Coemansia javaensis TaxID=2761396 RepID=A0A9W8HDF0_9FUNG|nr:hypothetical protein H4R18_001923 [Coemansia javaensis]